MPVYRLAPNKKGIYRRIVEDVNIPLSPLQKDRILAIDQRQIKSPMKMPTIIGRFVNEALAREFLVAYNFYQQYKESCMTGRMAKVDAAMDKLASIPHQYTSYFDHRHNYIRVHTCDICIDDHAQDLYPHGVEDLTPATPGSVGYDLKADLDVELITIAAGERYMISTGIRVQPKTPDIAAFVYSRSGLGTRPGLVVAQGVGVIDPDYTGLVKVCLLNTSQYAVTVRRGDKIAQMVFQSIVRPELHTVDFLQDTDRGSGGFGSTGM